MKAWVMIGLACVLLPLPAFAGANKAAVCTRGHFNFIIGPLSAAKGDPTITTVWLDGGEKDKKFALGHVMEASPNGDLVVLVSEPSKTKPGPGSVVIYTAGLHQAVFVADQDPDAETSVAIAHCTIVDVPKSKP